MNLPIERLKNSYTAIKTMLEIRDFIHSHKNGTEGDISATNTLNDILYYAQDNVLLRWARGFENQKLQYFDSYRELDHFCDDVNTIVHDWRENEWRLDYLDMGDNLEFMQNLIDEKNDLLDWHPTFNMHINNLEYLHPDSEIEEALDYIIDVYLELQKIFSNKLKRRGRFSLQKLRLKTRNYFKPNPLRPSF
jgi:hypothetical protein